MHESTHISPSACIPCTLVVTFTETLNFCCTLLMPQYSRLQVLPCVLWPAALTLAQAPAHTRSRAQGASMPLPSDHPWRTLMTLCSLVALSIPDA